jgi:hypothetical protein
MSKVFVSSSCVGVVLLAAGLASPAMAQFSYPNFSSVANLTFNGVAAQTGNTISVTPPVGSSAGSVWRTGNQSVGLGFVTNFTFRINDILGVGADGFAFVIQNEGTSALGGTGGALGYATNLTFPSQIGIGNSIAIEFDTWNNASNWPDFGNSNHVSIQTNGLSANLPGSANSLGSASPGANFSDAGIHAARIVYTPGLMQVFLDDMINPIISAPLTITDHMLLTSGRAFVGFTAATGGAANAERHEILSWDFSDVVPAPGAVSLLALGGLMAARRRRA